jgi:uncharacterized membrane protein YgcG
MSAFLIQLDQAQKRLPVGLPQTIGADLLVTLLMWQQLSVRYRVESKLVSGQCAGQTSVVADMLSAIPIPFSPECLFDACQWRQDDAGSAIHQSLFTLCQQQPQLDRIFRPERFGPDAPWAALFADNSIWADIMQLLGSIPATPFLSAGTVYQQAMAHLLPKAHPLPAHLAKLIATLLAPLRRNSVYDPAFGTGQLLFAVLAYVEAHNRTHLLRLRGQTTDPDQWACAALYLLAKEIDYHQLQRGDTLTAPLLNSLIHSPGSPVETAQLLKSDLILCQLPEQATEWDYAFARFDTWQRFPVQVPQDARIALIWHMLASLAENGRMALVVPQNLIHDPDAQVLWRYVVQHQQLDTVIELPRQQGQSAPQPLILLLRGQNTAKQVAFIHPRIPALLGAGIAPPRYDAHSIKRAWQASQVQGQHPYLHRVGNDNLAANEYSLLLADYAPPRHAADAGNSPPESGGGNSGSRSSSSRGSSSSGSSSSGSGSSSGSSSSGSGSSSGSSSGSGSSSSSGSGSSSGSDSDAGSTARAVWRAFGTNPVPGTGVVPGGSWQKKPV